MSRLAAFALVWIAGCHELPVQVRLAEVAPARPPHVTSREDGRVLLTIERATGLQIAALPSGDVVIVGWAAQPFAMRLSARGDVRWQVPLSRCDGVHLAVGGDDAIYVLAGSVAVTQPPSKDCDRATSGEHGMLYKLDGHGATAWRVPAPSTPTWLIASADRVVAGGYGGEFAVAASGQLAWSHANSESSSTAAALAGDGTVVISGAPVKQTPGIPGADGPCLLRALDGATGEQRWRRDLEPAASWCLDRSVEIRGGRGVVHTNAILDPGERTRGAIVFVHFLTGFDVATGAPRWHREASVEGKPFEPVPAIGAPFAADSPIELRYQLTPPPEPATAVVVVAIDVDTGDERAVGVVSAALPRSGAYSLVSISQLASDGRALIAAGEFTGTLSVGGLHAESPHRAEPQCVYDAGYPGSEPMSCHQAETWRPEMFVARVPFH